MEKDEDVVLAEQNSQGWFGFDDPVPGLGTARSSESWDSQADSQPDNLLALFTEPQAFRLPCYVGIASRFPPRPPSP